MVKITRYKRKTVKILRKRIIKNIEHNLFDKSQAMIILEEIYKWELSLISSSKIYIRIILYYNSLNSSSVLFLD